MAVVTWSLTSVPAFDLTAAKGALKCQIGSDRRTSCVDGGDLVLTYFCLVSVEIFDHLSAVSCSDDDF